VNSYEPYVVTKTMIIIIVKLSTFSIIPGNCSVMDRHVLRQTATPNKGFHTDFARIRVLFSVSHRVTCQMSALCTWLQTYFTRIRFLSIHCVFSCALPSRSYEQMILNRLRTNTVSLRCALACAMSNVHSVQTI